MSEMTPYFTITKCNKLFITYLTRSTECLPTLPSSISIISTISVTVVMTTLFNMCARCSVNFNPLNNGLISHAKRLRKMYSERGRYVISIGYTIARSGLRAHNPRVGYNGRVTHALL